ncbi:hypothetical protein [Sphingopyxis macrogoltabida]|uniref:Lipoprotein n=1 Tax=Sphingopyxis macrogoltabida TaxID=33050 RepID=A0A0N9V1S1_SPHMC|nr:hypothetical protein [Sphingopyxis macrogoltabida]ALH82273.1 hypothetical protein AN936_18525 [Sphingopyxis macrogoltabida]
MYNIVFRVLLPIVALQGCTPLADEHVLLDDACAVAVAHAASFKRDESRPIAIRPSPVFGTPTVGELDAILAKMPDASGDLGVLLMRKAAKEQDAVVVDRCPSLKIWLSNSNVISSNSEIDRLTRKEPWPVAVLTMSLPAVSDDASTALIYVSEDWGGLAGGTYAVTYRKEAGKWIEREREQLSIS